MIFVLKRHRVLDEFYWIESEIAQVVCRDKKFELIDYSEL